jgi:hypothetical protein
MLRAVPDDFEIINHDDVRDILMVVRVIKQNKLMTKSSR